MVLVEPNGSSSAKPLKSQDREIGSNPPAYDHPEGTYSSRGSVYPNVNVRPSPAAEVYSTHTRLLESPKMRFIKAFCVAALVWVLCGAFVKSLVWSVGYGHHRGAPWSGEYPIPSGLRLERCLEQDGWEKSFLQDGQNAHGDQQLLPPSSYPYASKATFELPVSSDSLYLLARGAYASGNVDILTSSEQKQDSATVHVTVRYYRQEVRDLVKLCKISRTAGESGVGIFTPRVPDRRYPGNQLYFETVIVLPQSTRGQSPLRMKKLETEVHNMAHNVHGLSEHVVFGNIILSGSNAHISAINLAADVASLETSNGAISGTYNASRELSLVTSDGEVKVSVYLGNELSSTPSKLHVKTSNGLLKADISLYASNPTLKTQYPRYEVDTKTSNDRLDVTFHETPNELTLSYDGYTSNGRANLQLPAAYEGSFKVSTSSSSGGPDLRVRSNVPDPTGRGRKREVQRGSKFKGILTGSVAWVGNNGEDKGPEKGTVELRTSNAKAILVL